MGKEKNDCASFAEQWRFVKDGFSRGVKYDGCTGAPDLDFGEDCCGEHDYHYQIGDISRAEADKRLRECMAKKGYKALPWIYWGVVRVFAGGVWKRYRNEETDNRSFDDRAA